MLETDVDVSFGTFSQTRLTLTILFYGCDIVERVISSTIDSLTSPRVASRVPFRPLDDEFYFLLTTSLGERLESRVAPPPTCCYIVKFSTSMEQRATHKASIKGPAF